MNQGLVCFHEGAGPVYINEEGSKLKNQAFDLLGHLQPNSHLVMSYGP